MHLYSGWARVKSHMAEHQFGQLGIFQPFFGGVIGPRLKKLVTRPHLVVGTGNEIPFLVGGFTPS